MVISILLILYIVCLFFVFFFFKQKTAYEMRISDWSSDVCSSDLTFIAPLLADPHHGAVRSVTPYLWVWGIGGVLGSFFIGPLVDRIKEIGRASCRERVCQYV